MNEILYNHLFYLIAEGELSKEQQWFRNILCLLHWNGPRQRRPGKYNLYIQVALVICGLFICNFEYMRSGNDLFSGTYPLIYCNPWSFYMRIHYMRAYFWSPYLSHITRFTCIYKALRNHHAPFLKNTKQNMVEEWIFFLKSKRSFKT